VIIALLILVAVGCSSDSTDRTPPSTAPAEPAVAGTVTLDVSEVTDATNLVLLSVIGNAVPTQPVAAVCAIVDSDEFNFTGHFLPITGDDPCTLGSEPVQFEPGSYDVIVAVLPGGSTTPERCTQAKVTVDGHVTLEVVSLGAPDDCDLW
jgi:hypothetical protein